MLNVAVFPNIDKENAPMVLKRIVDFYHDKDVKILMPMDGAKFFDYGKYGVEDIENHLDLTLVC